MTTVSSATTYSKTPLQMAEAFHSKKEKNYTETLGAIKGVYEEMVAAKKIFEDFKTNIVVKVEGYQKETIAVPAKPELLEEEKRIFLTRYHEIKNYWEHDVNDLMIVLKSEYESTLSTLTLSNNFTKLTNPALKDLMEKNERIYHSFAAQLTNEMNKVTKLQKDVMTVLTGTVTETTSRYTSIANNDGRPVAESNSWVAYLFGSNKPVIPLPEAPLTTSQIVPQRQPQEIKPESAPIEPESTQRNFSSDEEEGFEDNIEALLNIKEEDVNSSATTIQNSGLFSFWSWGSKTQPQQ